MTLYERAKKLAQIERFDDDDIVTIETNNVKYLKKSFKNVIIDSVKSLVNVIGIEAQNDLVLYPGCATDIVRCMLITCAKTLIGVDLVDPYFYLVYLKVIKSRHQHKMFLNWLILCVI